MDYSLYKNSYDADIFKEWKEGTRELDLESLRGLLFGFTFTDDYRKLHIDEGFSMDYWRDKKMEDDDEYDYDIEVKSIEEILEEAMASKDMYEVDTPQERLLMEVLDSTGDGETVETAISVIDVGQEYEYLERKFPFSCITVSKQELVAGCIDCLHFHPNPYDIECIYFDIRRRFEVGYSLKKRYKQK